MLLVPQIVRTARATRAAGPHAAAIALTARVRRNASQKIVEFAQLVEIVGKQRPTVVVEIGTFLGGTLWTWAKVAADEALIVSIDLPGGTFGGGYRGELVETFKRYAERGQRVELLRRDSHDPGTLAELERLLAGRMIDFLFIDGDHSYAGVKKDFEMYAPLVRGLVAFHDVLRSDWRDSQVDTFWNEIKGSYAHEEFLDPDHLAAWGRWGGIGVLYLGDSGMGN